MTITAVPVDQRVIDIDSRRFASIEKALVELITNGDDSYARLEAAEQEVSGLIRVRYERHQAGALLVVADQAEGMPFARACAILAYGGAHSPLARGETGGRGYFGRGLKQAIFGLGHGWIETIHAGRYSRIELFRGEMGDYLYEDGGGDRPALPADYERLETASNGTQVTLVVEHPHVPISHYRSVLHAVAHNVYLRDVLNRRRIELIHLQQGKETERHGPVRYEEPPSLLLVGPDQPGSFQIAGEVFPFTLTLKRALDKELTLKGDERTNGLVVLAGTAVLDCQLFAHENRVGTEYLFGTVKCPGLGELLGRGQAIVSDEREGLNRKSPVVEAFSQAVSRMIEPYVEREQEKLKHLEQATTSGRTGQMIDHLLRFMSQAAARDLGIMAPVADLPASEPELPPPLRFTTPFYYRRFDTLFQVTLLLDLNQFFGDEVLAIDYDLSPTLLLDRAPESIPVSDLGGTGRVEWTVMGGSVGDRGKISVRAGTTWAWCEIAMAREASRHSRGCAAPTTRSRRPRDHGIDMFVGYEFRNLHNELERAVYSPAERKILINTGAPTVQLYVDGRGHFRDSARLLLAELFMDVISDELARITVDRTGAKGNVRAYHNAKQDIIRRYGSEIHLSFLSG